MPKLSIVIVSWNVQDLLRRCLASLAVGDDGLPDEIIVVDGASADGSADMVQAEFPFVRVLRQTENVGFSRGNNLGLAEATGRYLCLLNPDTEVVGDALRRMVRYLETHPEVGVVGPKLLYPDGRVQSSRRRFPTLATAFFESTWLQPIAPPSLLRHYYGLDLPEEETSEVDWVTGACLMVRRQAYEAAGPLDEGYFMYSEEMEWQRRIQAAGWQVIYYPAAEVIHHEGKSSEQVIPERHIYFQRSKLRYFYSYHGRLAGSFLRAFLLLSYAWQLALEAGKGALGHKRPLRQQRIAAYWRVLRSGLPPARGRAQDSG